MLIASRASKSKGHWRRWAPLFAGLSSALWCRDGAAQETLSWEDPWRRVGPVEYALTPTFLAGSAVITWLVPAPDEAHWTRPLLFDSAARAALRSESHRGRAVAALVGDAALLVSSAQPLLVDPVLVAGVGRESWDVGWQMGVISAQSYAVTVLLNSVSKRAFARQRPYALGCLENSDYTDSCESDDRFRSFYSGHSAFTATGAGLVCAHHLHVPLYGGGFRDTSACLASVGLALLTGSMRIVADRHWSTDVFVGHVIGFATGFVIPTLVYYQGQRAESAETVSQEQHASAPVILNWGGTF